MPGPWTESPRRRGLGKAVPSAAAKAGPRAAKAVPLPQAGAAREPGKAGHGGRSPRQISDSPGILGALLLAPALLAPGPRHSLQAAPPSQADAGFPANLQPFQGLFALPCSQALARSTQTSGRQLSRLGSGWGANYSPATTALPFPPQGAGLGLSHTWAG